MAFPENEEELNDLLQTHWPHDVRRPTLDEYRDANERYRKRFPNNQYARIVSEITKSIPIFWLHYFFPWPTPENQGHGSSDTPM